MNTRHAYWLGALFLGLATPLMAGQVPIHGVTGTIALPENVDNFYSGLNKALAKTNDGIHHISRQKKTRVDGRAASLDGLQPGAAVVVHYTVKGIQTSANPIDAIRGNGVTPNDGIVMKVDRQRNHITIEFADGTTETLRITHDQLDDSNARRSRMIVYYSDVSGRKVSRYFKRVGS